MSTEPKDILASNENGHFACRVTTLPTRHFLELPVKNSQIPFEPNQEAECRSTEVGKFVGSKPRSNLPCIVRADFNGNVALSRHSAN